MFSTSIHNTLIAQTLCVLNQHKYMRRTQSISIYPPTSRTRVYPSAAPMHGMGYTITHYCAVKGRSDGTDNVDVMPGPDNVTRRQGSRQGSRQNCQPREAIYKCAAEPNHHHHHHRHQNSSTHGWQPDTHMLAAAAAAAERAEVTTQTHTTHASGVKCVSLTFVDTRSH